MANQKVKHIIAKLVGQSTESTLDVYDVDAVHTDKIANNLTTTSSGYVLDARQGKALNDSLAASHLEVVYSLGGTNNLDLYYYKWGKVVMVTGGGPITNPSSLTGVDQIGEIPEGYRPRGSTYVMAAGMRTTGPWAEATYYHATVLFNGDGTFNLRGKASEMKLCTQITVTGCWLIP